MSGSRFSKLVSVVITGVIAISGLPSMVLADMINAPTYYSVQSELDYEITTNITSSWSNHESIDLVLTNTGSDTIHNWYLTFNTPYNIENIWNSTINETDGNGTYTITSNGWNQDIHTGESVTVGITFSSDTETELSINPEWYLLNTQATVVDASLYTLDYTEYSSWESGFTGQLVLQPQIDCQHWSLTFNSNREITSVSSAVLNTEDNSSYEITHDENNMRLFANNAYNFGIQGVNSENALEFTGVELTVVDLAYHLTDDLDGNGTPDYLDFMGGGSIVDPTPTPTDTPTVSPTEEPTTPTDEPADTPTPTEEPTPPEETDPDYYMRDSDNDGLLDFQEVMYVTDPDNPDTDGDGLLDGDEIKVLTSPRIVDTDDNGISDFEEDYDGDGIHNGGEYVTGTCMFAYDSDFDGVNDYNEVYFYGIDPNNEDSDFDGIKDGDEVILGLNPGSNDSNGDGVTDDYVMFEQSLFMDPIVEDHPHEITSVQINGGISGLITSNTTIEDMYNRDVYCTGVYGRVGVPINIESEGHFDSMTLTISYDDSILGETDENNLGVLWYNEENGFFIVQEQAVVDTTNNIVTLELNHFSTYILVDLNKWNSLPITPNTSITGSMKTITWSTRGVYYGDPVIETNSQGQLVLVGWANQTASPERYENTAWGLYLESHPNDVRVDTVNMRYIRDSWGGLTYVYTWNIYTADTTVFDNDQDGLPDNLEISGILGTNGEVYYSDPNSIDSDEDTLTDGEEIGNLYMLHRDEDGKLTISLNNTVIYESEDGSISPDSTYFYFHRYTMLLGCGQYLGVACVKSDPKKQYSDGDSARDDEDARPMTLNVDYIYVFTNPDFLYESRISKNLYENEGYNVYLFEFNNASRFLEAWEGIGLSFDFYRSGNKPYGDKYYYNAKCVAINTHGSEVSLTLGSNTTDSPDMLYAPGYWVQSNDVDYGIVRVYQLIPKKIESLNLYACSCGRSNSGISSLAESFLIIVEGIEQVIAADTLLFSCEGHFYFMSYGLLVTCSIDEYSQFENNVDGLRCYYCVDYRALDNPEGFLVFSKIDDQTVVSRNIYNDDVFTGGVMYIMDNQEYEGYLVYDYDVPGSTGDTYHDPIIESGLL